MFNFTINNKLYNYYVLNYHFYYCFNFYIYLYSFYLFLYSKIYFKLLKIYIPYNFKVYETLLIIQYFYS